MKIVFAIENPGKINEVRRFPSKFIATSDPELLLWRFEESSPDAHIMSSRESAFKKLFKILSINNA